MDYFCCHNDRDAKENILNGSSRESNASSVGLGRLSVHVGRGGGRGRVGRGDSNHSGNYGSGRGYPADRFHGGGGRGHGGRGHGGREGGGDRGGGGAMSQIVREGGQERELGKGKRRVGRGR